MKETKLDRFNHELIEPFETNTDIDGNYTVIYQGKVVRVIEDNVEDYKELLLYSGEVQF